MTRLGVFPLLMFAGLARAAGADAPATPRAIVALGRLAPKDGIVKVAGPSEPVLVVADVLVQPGSWVKAGAPIARLDDYEAKASAVQQLRATVAASDATIAGIQATLSNVEAEAARQEELYRQGLVSLAQRDDAKTRVDVEKARIRTAQADRDVRVADLKNAEILLERRAIRAPVAGQVLQLHVRPGEKVGPLGIAEIARTDQMYAIAEVYETDVHRVKVGQRATVSSRALPGGSLQGTVERIGLLVGRKDIFGDDPTARKDERVVEVEVRLDDSKAVSGLTNLQVEVKIAP